MPATRALSGLALLAFAGAVLAGCHHTSDRTVDLPPNGTVYIPQTEVPSRDVFSLEVAERICGIDSLTSQYRDMQRQVRELRAPGLGYPYGTGGGHDTEEETETNRTVTRPEPGPQTAQVEMVRTLEVDLDASYRFATAACQSYAVCMYQRRYAEGACQDPRREWTDAQRRFDGLSGRIAQTRVDLAERTAARPHRPQGHHRPPPPPADGPCSGRMGNIFTTAGCRP